MAPRWAVHLLGLGNLVAGAFLASGVIPPTASGESRLLAHSAALFLTAIGIGAWVMPAAAQPRYLWTFGVALKAAGALLWGVTAWETGIAWPVAGAAADAVIAFGIGAGLTAGRQTHRRTGVGPAGSGQDR